jgi:hypothetical protein
LYGLGQAISAAVSAEWVTACAGSGPNAEDCAHWLARNGQDDVWFRQIVCACGSTGTFQVWSADGFSSDWVGGEHGGSQRVELRCGSCRTAILLFDDGLHGYNAVVCDDRAGLPDNYLAANQPLLTQLTCGCGGPRFAVVAQAIYDLYDEDLATIPEDQWDDSFGFFAAAGRCTSCGAIVEIAAAETA